MSYKKKSHSTFNFRVSMEFKSASSAPTRSLRGDFFRWLTKILKKFIKQFL
jgi:hypothetical protein